MRGLIFLFACLALVNFAWGNHLILGERLPNDVKVQDRYIYKPPIPRLGHTVTIGATAPPGQVVSYFSVTNEDPSTVSIEPVKGAIGTSSIVAVGHGNVGSPLHMKVVVYANSGWDNSTSSSRSSSTSTTPCPGTSTPKSSTKHHPTDDGSHESTSTRKSTTKHRPTHDGSHESTSTRKTSTKHYPMNDDSHESTSTRKSTTKHHPTHDDSHESTSTRKSTTKNHPTHDDSDECTSTHKTSTKQHSTDDDGHGWPMRSDVDSRAENDSQPKAKASAWWKWF